MRSPEASPEGGHLDHSPSVATLLAAVREGAPQEARGALAELLRAWERQRASGASVHVMEQEVIDAMEGRLASPATTDDALRTSFADMLMRLKEHAEPSADNRTVGAPPVRDRIDALLRRVPLIPS